MSLSHYTELLRQGKNLDRAQTGSAACSLASSETPENDKAAFLIALADKGESPAEVAGFAEAFRSMALDPGLQLWAPRAVDIVGTGGDHAGGFNLSSIVVLVLACAGLPVMKHGNRGVTSKCGSADLFSAFGFDLGASPEKLRRALDQLGYVFLFAPNFHPAFKHIAPVRRRLAGEGRRTVFNILGPLINPGRPAHLLMGVFSSALVGVLADASTCLGTQSGLAVFGEIAEGRGIDEMTTATPNHVRGIGRLASLSSTWRAQDFGLEPSPFNDLLGGDVATNMAIVEALLEGKAPRGLSDTVILNAAACLWLAGRVESIRSGVPVAREILAGGAVRAKIDATREFFAKA